MVLVAYRHGLRSSELRNGHPARPQGQEGHSQTNPILGDELRALRWQVAARGDGRRRPLRAARCDRPYDSSMPSPCRFPPPWSVEETDGCFIVRDATGHAPWPACISR